MMRSVILVLDARASSLDFQVFGLEVGLPLLLRGRIDGIARSPRFEVETSSGASVVERALGEAEGRDHGSSSTFLAAWLQQEDAGPLRLAAVGHRVSHGGLDYTRPVLVDRAVLARLESYAPLAPLFQPYNLAPIRLLLEAAPETPQVACFETAFHATQPEVAKLFGLPRRFYDEGVRRYGFHGLSYESIARRLPEVAPGLARRRVVVAHLGSEASLCAMVDLKSVATTFGFTVVDGLPMGTHCGALDPGVIIYLARERGMSLADIEAMLYEQSGLLGLSGISGDVRALLASNDPGAELALDYFVYRVSRELGSLAAALGGVDGLVFTAAVDEGSIELRARVLQQAAWLGVDVDVRANAAGAGRISSDESCVAVWVIPTHEALLIAEHVLALL